MTIETVLTRIDADLDASVVVVEWGHGVAEQLSADRLEVVLQVVGPGETRQATVWATGERWADPTARAALAALASGAPLADD